LLDQLDEWRLLQNLFHLQTKALTLTDSQLKLVVEDLNLDVAVCLQLAINLSQNEDDGAAY
jgi:hypothetical protein